MKGNSRCLCVQSTAIAILAFLAVASVGAAIDSTVTSQENMSHRLRIEGSLHHTAIMHSTSNDGVSWSSPMTLFSSQYNPREGVYSLDGKTIHLAWEDGSYRIHFTYYTRSSDGGRTWAKPLRLDGSAPMMSVDGSTVIISTKGLGKDCTTFRSFDCGRNFVKEPGNSHMSCNAQSMAANIQLPPPPNITSVSIPPPVKGKGPNGYTSATLTATTTLTARGMLTGARWRVWVQRTMSCSLR